MHSTTASSQENTGTAAAGAPFAGHPAALQRGGGMRLNRMRWADNWLGLPLCFMFGLASMLLRALLPHRDRTYSGRGTLVILKFFGLGTILEATPMLRAFRQQHPEAPVVFVTFDSSEALLRRLDVFTELRVLRTASPGKFVWDCLRLIAWMLPRPIEAVMDLEFFSKFSTLLSFLCGAHIRIGYHLNDFWRRSLVTHPVYFNYFRHITDAFREAGRHLGVRVTDDRLMPARTDAPALESARQCLLAAGWDGAAPLLGVNVNAGDLCLERRWPIDRFGMVLTRLLEDRPLLRLVLTGSAVERPYVSSVLEAIPAPLRPRVFNAAGAWSLGEFLAGLSLLEGLLTVDSGPMHIAAAQGVPVVSIWGPQRPEFYAPRVGGIRTVYANYPCSPCIHMFTSFEGMWCNHQAWCMDAIQPQAVLEAVNAMLEQQASGSRLQASGTETPAAPVA